MAIFHYISILVPTTLAVAAPCVLKKKGFDNEKKYRWILYAACLLFFISWYLPSPLIDGQDTSFMKHFVGGGLFTGLFWAYLISSMKWRAHWLIMAFSLFALVSALGCINELAELFMVKAGIAKIEIDDTNWDILANTLGAATIWVDWLIVDFMTKKGRLSGDSRN